MKIKDFKSHTITRSSPPHYSNYRDYRPYLESDFSEENKKEIKIIDMEETD